MTVEGQPITLSAGRASMRSRPAGSEVSKGGPTPEAVSQGLMEFGEREGARTGPGCITAGGVVSRSEWVLRCNSLLFTESKN